MRSLKYLLLLSLASTGLLLSGPAAKADSYSFSLLTPLNQSAVAGETIEFDAIITNLDPSNGLYLADNVVSLSPQLTLDDTAFLNIPWPLSPAGKPGDSYTGALFDVIVAPGTANGTYSGEYQVLGGSDGINYDVLVGDVQFTMDVGGSNPVPEPSSLVLMLTGMAGLAGTLRRRLIR